METVMSVPAAFIGVIIIWSTTPLAIKWSADGSGFLFGVSARMVIGTLLCLTLARVMRVKLPWHREALQTYAAAAIGVYGAMTCVYWGAQFVPSGLISILFGLAPIVTGGFAAYWLKERSLTPVKIAGSLIGMAGLALIFGSQRLDVQAGAGLAAVLVSVVLHSLSSVWVKRTGTQLPALAVTTGALLFALPLYLLTWLLLDGHLPSTVPERAIASIVYLGILGSGIGFILYYYTLRHIEAGRVALIPLITPVLAVILGSALNGEVIDAREIAGAALILSGLLFYEIGERIIPALRGDGEQP